MIYTLTDPTCWHTLAATHHHGIAATHLDLLWTAGRTDFTIATLTNLSDVDTLTPPDPDCPTCAARDAALMTAMYRRDLIAAADTAHADTATLVDYFTSLVEARCGGDPALSVHAAHHAATAALEQRLIPPAAVVVIEPAMFGEA